VAVRIFSQHQEIEKLVVANIEPIKVKFFLEAGRMEGIANLRCIRDVWGEEVRHAFLD
jgi:hypothetical protein